MLRVYSFVKTPHHFLNDNLLSFFDRIEFETGEYSSLFFDKKFYDDIVSHHPKVLEKPLIGIYNVIKQWDQEKRSEFCKRVRDSNDIEGICKREYNPLKISELDKEITDVVNVKKLFSDLYTQVLYGEHCLKSYGSMQEHFTTFKSDKNDIFKCPVCGLIPQNTKAEKKEDYDHLLPYTIYPFSSVNFKNLAPICVDCNSDYKEDKDVLDNGGKKIFCYYDRSHKGIKIDAILNDEKNYDFAFAYITEDDRKEEIESWDNIFGITGRYIKRAKGKAASWYRHYWEFLKDPTFSDIELATKKLMYAKISEKDPDIEIIKSPVIEAMENSALQKAFQTTANYKMEFDNT